MKWLLLLRQILLFYETKINLVPIKKKRKREIKIFMSSVSASVIDIPSFMAFQGRKKKKVAQSSMCLQDAQTGERTQITNQAVIRTGLVTT